MASRHVSLNAICFSIQFNIPQSYTHTMHVDTHTMHVDTDHESGECHAKIEKLRRREIIVIIAIHDSLITVTIEEIFLHNFW